MAREVGAARAAPQIRRGFRTRTSRNRPMVRASRAFVNFTALTFYFFSAVLIGAAAMVVTIRNPVKSALFLVLTFFSAACIWMTLEAEFLAIVLVLVYVGAVMVLFLFVVMMLDINLERLREGNAASIDTSAIHLDLLRDLKRIHSHLTAIAYTITERTPPALKDTG